MVGSFVGLTVGFGCIVGSFVGSLVIGCFCTLEFIFGLLMVGDRVSPGLIGAAEDEVLDFKAANETEK